MSGQRPFQPDDPNYSIFEPQHGVPTHTSPEAGMMFLVAPSVLNFLQNRDAQKTERERIGAELKTGLADIEAKKQSVLAAIHGQIKDAPQLIEATRALISEAIKEKNTEVALDLAKVMRELASITGQALDHYKNLSGNDKAVVSNRDEKPSFDPGP